MDTGGVVREGLQLLVVVAGPVMMVLLVTGLITGILQAATQINDPAVGFLPRLVVAIGAAWLWGPWMVERLAVFLAASVGQWTAGPLP